MYTYRKVQEQDWPQIIKLVNSVFQENLPMEITFPLLFQSGNKTSYVAVNKNQVIGFIGVMLEELVTETKEYYGVRVGAVCTDSVYQGKGIGRKLFQFMKKDLANSLVNFALVSGQGRLYTSEGCQLFGEFRCYEMRECISRIDCKIYEFSGEAEQYIAIHHALQKRKTYFKKSINEFMVNLKANSMGTLHNSKQLIVTGSYQGEFGVVIANQSEYQGKKIDIFEWSGSSELLLAMMNDLKEKNPEYIVTIRISTGDKHNDFFEKFLPYEVEKNAGTNYYFQSELEAVEFPHTWDLAFL